MQCNMVPYLGQCATIPLYNIFFSKSLMLPLMAVLVFLQGNILVL